MVYKISMNYNDYDFLYDNKKQIFINSDPARIKDIFYKSHRDFQILTTSLWAMTKKEFQLMKAVNSCFNNLTSAREQLKLIVRINDLINEEWMRLITSVEWLGIYNAISKINCTFRNKVHLEKEWRWTLCDY